MTSSSQEFLKDKGGEAPKQKRKTKSAHAGLVMPVTRFHKALKDRKRKYAKTIRVLASVYMAAAIEYLCAEILEVAGDQAAAANRVRITPRYINLAIREDAELNELLKKVVVPQGGVQPYIHNELLKKKSK